MSETLLEQNHAADPEAITRLFAHVALAPVDAPERDSIFEEADAAWLAHPEVEITQDEVSGTISQGSEFYRLGSYGISVIVKVETIEGTQDLQLQFDGTEPLFEIKPKATPSKALEVNPKSPDYATLPTEQAFDWNEIIKSAREHRELPTDPLYLVVFRSTLKEGADVSTLNKHDQLAHDAALESPALIHYHGGVPNKQGQALSFCLWEDPESAKSISKDRRHADAAAMVDSYETYSIEKYSVEHYQDQIRLNPVTESHR